MRWRERENGKRMKFSLLFTSISIYRCSFDLLLFTQNRFAWIFSFLWSFLSSIYVELCSFYHHSNCHFKNVYWINCCSVNFVFLSDNKISRKSFAPSDTIELKMMMMVMMKKKWIYTSLSFPYMFVLHNLHRIFMVCVQWLFVIIILVTIDAEIFCYLYLLILRFYYPCYWFSNDLLHILSSLRLRVFFSFFPLYSFIH